MTILPDVIGIEWSIGARDQLVRQLCGEQRQARTWRRGPLFFLILDTTQLSPPLLQPRQEKLLWN